MKWNWGKGIALTYTVFVIAVLIHTAIFMNQKVELVTDNYYEKEIKYQDQINKINNTKSLKQGITFEQDHVSIKLIFPGIYIDRNVKGEIYFYKPSDSGKDFILAIRTDENKVQLINTEKLAKGLWKIRVSWNVDEVQYYNEETIMIS